MRLSRYSLCIISGMSLAVISAFTSAQSVFINEFHYDNTGADAGEFVEVAGSAGVSLDGWTVELYNGNGGGLYDVIALMGTLPDEGAGFGALSFLRAGIQNGSPDGLALVDPEGSVWEFLSYEGQFEATGGSATGLVSTDVGVSEPFDTAIGLSLQRSGDAGDNPGCNWTGPLGQSPGALNAGQFLSEAGCPAPDPEPVDACFDPATPIHAIQGSGLESPLEGSEQTVEAVVVGDFQGGDNSLEGFFLQEEDGDADGDPATSEGIFVFDGGFGVDVQPGDLVRVSGTVDEFFGLTELTSVTRVEVCGEGPPVTPAEPLFPLATEADLEAFEGMAVRLTQQLRIAEYFNFDRFGEIVLALPQTGDRPFQPTSLAEPGADALAIQRANDLRRITLDDGLSSQNPGFLRHPNGEAFAVDNRFRGGDVVTDVEGALSYSFGRYRIQPTAAANHIAMNPRPESPEPVGGSLKVASFNVLNYFTTIDAGSPVCGPDGGLDCRGADSAEEFARQRTKIIAALAAMDADVVGLIEIENNAAASLQDLVAGLNAVSGDGSYDYIDTGTIGADAIKVAFVYRPATVTPVGPFAILDGSVDSRFVDTRNRPVLAQTFSENASAARFTVAVNHLKSKGSDCDDLGDPDAGDGQGNCNLTRRDAALAQVDWLATDPTGSGDADVMIIGDINAYAKEDPVDAILAGADDTPGTGDDFINLIEVFEGAEAYSFVFSGQFGYLDHAFANQPLSTQVTGVTEWHINADEPDALDYNTDFNPAGLYAPDAFRSSDHDPVIVGLELETTLADIVAFIDRAIEDGLLQGIATGRPERLLAAFRDGLARMVPLELSGNQGAACAGVRRSLLRIDGSGRPQDWVGGPAAPQVAALLSSYFSDSACEERPGAPR